MRGFRAIVAVLAVVAGGLVGPTSPAHAVDGPEVGEFHLTAPTRILDTRIGVGRAGALASREAIAIDPRAAAPGLGFANAYVLNVTVVSPSSGGYLELAPWSDTGQRVTRSSAVNFVPGRTVANLATAWTDVRDPRLALINWSGGPTHVVVDVLGYYSFGTAPVSPGVMAPRTTASFGRVLDTRASGSVPPNGSITFSVAGVADTSLGTAVANVTVVGAAASGYVSSDPANRTSVVNFLAGDTVANLAYLPIQDGKTVTLFNRTTGPLNLVVDIAGEFYAGTAPRAPGVPLYDGRFVSVPTTRVVDSRVGLVIRGPVPPGGTFRIPLTGVPAGATAVVVNLTTVDASATGWVTAWATGTPEPGTSNVNVVPGRAVANLAVVPLGSDGTVTVSNHNVAGVQLIADVAGYYVGA